MADTEIIELLAEIEHEQWMAWAKSLMDNEALSPKRLERWMPLMVPYSKLSKDMKEHDGKWAKITIAALAAAGLVVVPREPTEGQLIRGNEELSRFVDMSDADYSTLEIFSEHIAEAYKAMIGEADTEIDKALDFMDEVLDDAGFTKDSQ